MIDQIISFEEMEFKLFRRLSDCLDISFSELIEIFPILTPVYCKEKIIKGYRVSFRYDAPGEILEKIRGISVDHTVYLGFYLINEMLPEKHKTEREIRKHSFIPKHKKPE